MPKEFDDILKAIKQSLSGKTNPKTNKQYTDSELYAMAVSAYKKKYGKTPEGAKDWRRIEYVVPIKESVMNNGEFMIKGTAINETVTRNGTKYTGDELSKSSHSLIGKPLLKDHVNSVDNIVGKVRAASYDDMNRCIPFQAAVMDKKMQEMINDGRISSVSIGAMVQDLERPQEEGADYVVAKGIEFVELSLVAVPADPNANFAKACMESYQNKSLMEEYDDFNIEEDTKTEKTEEKMKLICSECGKKAEGEMGMKCPECGADMKPINDKEEEKMAEDMEKIMKEHSEMKEKLAKIEEDKRIAEAVEKKLAEEKAKLESSVDKTKGQVKKEQTEETKTTSEYLLETSAHGAALSMQSYDASKFKRLAR